VSLSSNNIFLAAFQQQSINTDDNDVIEDLADAAPPPAHSNYCERFVSSALIDSCDKKYDKLYR
jgi:hypothetical protein